MSTRSRQLGVDLRPHMKTTKSTAIAKLATDGHSGAITVSTLREAEYFAQAGYRDILYGVCVTPNKLDRVARLTDRGVQLTVIVDSVVVAQALADHPGIHFAMVEIDCGEDRTGLRPDDAALLTCAEILFGAPRVGFRGVVTHGGQSYGVNGRDRLAAVAEIERAAVVSAAERLRNASIPVEIVSVGSTPTALFAEHLQGVTEMRPGVYMLGDLFQAGLGTCLTSDLASTVLSTVISHREASNRLVIDAGALALSKDRSTSGQTIDTGYGLIADGRTGQLIEGLRIDSVHQEHGEVISLGTMPWEALPIGATVRVLPNHICMTAAMYDRYAIIDGDDAVHGFAERVNGWRADR